MRRPALPLAATASAAAILISAAGPAAAHGDRSPGPFRELPTFAVTDLDADDDVDAVAEIIAATPNGRTLLYTDSAQGVLGIVDISRPERPRQVGAVAVEGSPTSVAVTRDGRYALVGVDTSASLAQPSGFLAVVELRSGQIVHRVDLGGQPDSVAISPDGKIAVIAIENQRDEEVVVGGVEGGLPQLPAGYLSVVGLQGRVSGWTAERVELTGLPDAAHPDDPEPEFVDIDDRGIAAVTLQENNVVALVDLERRKVVGSFSAGEATREDADLQDDGVISFTEPLTAPREPDAVQWTEEGNLVTADEGDLAAEPSGGRGWTVFAPDGAVVFTAGGSAERALAGAGRYPDDRSDDKGAEFEGVEVAAFDRDEYAFIGSERGNAVLVYAFDRESGPELLQVLLTGTAPEGLLALPRRDLFLASNEDDGTISIYTSARKR